MLPHGLLFGVAHDSSCSVIPFVYVSVHVNAKDGRVRGLDELPELLRNAGELDLSLLALRDVLPDTDHAINLAADVTPSGGV